MPFHVFFDFSTGLSGDVTVREGTFETMCKQVDETEKILGIECEEYNGVLRWKHPLVRNEELTDEEYCSIVDDHNWRVRWFYNHLVECQENAPKNREIITPEMAETFWFGLTILSVPLNRWTDEYYQARMDAMYDCLRGRESEGMSYGSDALSVSQAKDVIVMFSQWLDKGDIRLDVIKGEDRLCRSDDYQWCCSCGAVDFDDIDIDEEYCFECQEKQSKES